MKAVPSRGQPLSGCSKRAGKRFPALSPCMQKLRRGANYVAGLYRCTGTAGIEWPPRVLRKREAPSGMSEEDQGLIGAPAFCYSGRRTRGGMCMLDAFDEELWCSLYVRSWGGG